MGMLLRYHRAERNVEPTEADHATEPAPRKRRKAKATEPASEPDKAPNE